ncbi:MAG: ACT domain-containing protein [Pyrobaculum sp.]
MLNREIYLIANSSDARLGEFLIELNFDQPGILATLSNIFAEHDINIINIAIDAQRRNLHFIVDLTTVSEDQIREITKQLQMFAFVRKARYRVSNTTVFVPRWILHVVNGKPTLAIEKELANLLTQPLKLAEELAKRDVKTLKEVITLLNTSVLEEVLYIAQLRGLAVVENTAVKNGKLHARLCNLIYPLSKVYIETMLKEFGLHYTITEDSNCINLNI